jgi:tRNA pseudouridine13 synthase
MKLKCQPEDFRVEELPLVSPERGGRYTFYRLTKCDLGTLEAIELICRRWNLAGRRVSYGGLKDRHALTTQYVTIFDGPRKSIENAAFALEHLGCLNHPYLPAHFRGNRFDMVLRELAAVDAVRALELVEALRSAGLPNYFDDQRFGSVGYSGEFIAHAWLKGDAERALKLALAEANPSDRSTAKAQKAVLRECWGKWSEAKARLERSPTRSIITYLVDHPADFRGAFARMRRELRTLYFSAFQSHLWNLILARTIEHCTRIEDRMTVALKGGEFPFPRALEPRGAAALSDWPIPLPSSRNVLPGGVRGEWIQEVLSEYQLTWPDLRVRNLKDVFFSKGSRAALVSPVNLQAEVLDDELHPGKKSLRLSFDLGKGSYATILVKCITAGAGLS